jgi:hypothetical protein
MTIESIFILNKRSGADYIALNTDLPCGTYPFKEKASFATFVAAGTAEAYVREHFPGIPIRVVSEDDIPIPKGPETTREVNIGKR